MAVAPAREEHLRSSGVAERKVVVCFGEDSGKRVHQRLYGVVVLAQPFAGSARALHMSLLQSAEERGVFWPQTESEGVRHGQVVESALNEFIWGLRNCARGGRLNVCGFALLGFRLVSGLCCQVRVTTTFSNVGSTVIPPILISRSICQSFPHNIFTWPCSMYSFRTALSKTLPMMKKQI